MALLLSYELNGPGAAVCVGPGKGMKSGRTLGIRVCYQMKCLQTELAYKIVSLLPSFKPLSIPKNIGAGLKACRVSAAETHQFSVPVKVRRPPGRMLIYSRRTGTQRRVIRIQRGFKTQGHPLVTSRRGSLSVSATRHGDASLQRCSPNPPTLDPLRAVAGGAAVFIKTI